MMKKKKAIIAIISAGPDQITLVKKAKEMGIESHCFAWDKGDYSVCREYADYYHPISILEKEEILEKCREINIDGVVSVLNAHAIPTVAFVAEKMGLIGNKFDDSLIAVNKYKARRALINKGVNSPQFAISRNGELPDLMGFKFPVIVKPTDRSSSYGVTKVEDEKDIKEAILRAAQLSFEKEAIIEEFLHGQEVSAHTISWNGKHYFLAIRDKVTSGNPYFVEIAHHIPTHLQPDIAVKIENEAKKALDALNIKYGACDAEFIVTNDGEVYPVEINARMGGDYASEMIYHSTGLDYMKMTIDVALGCFKEPQINTDYFSGVYFLTKEQEWVKEVIENKEHDEEIVEAKITNSELKHVQCSADRSGYFIYKSNKKRTWKGY